MSNGFLRSLLVASAKMSPTVVKSLDGCSCGKVANVAVHRVGSLRAAREAFSRSDIRVVVVREQYVARCLKVGRPVLGLTVGSHHAVIAADAEVVLGRDSTGVIEGLLAGQDHRAVRCHDQNALGVHQHRRFGIPIRLRADVDSRDDDVDLTTVLGEGDDSAQRTGHPVHVLGAAVHRNGGAGGQREPLDRCGQLFGEIERGDHSGAFGFGHRAQRFRRVTEHRHPRHAFGVKRRAPCHRADDEPGGVASIRPVHRYEFARFVEVIFDERAVAAGENVGSARRGKPSRGLVSAAPSVRTRREAAAARSADPSHSRRHRRPECRRSESPLACGCADSSSLTLARMMISSSPALIVSGAMRRTIAGARSAGMSSTGHT